MENKDKIAFTTVTFRNLSARQICEIAAENKIEYIEWGGDIHLPPTDKEKREEIINLQKEYSLKANSYGSYYRLGQNDIRLWKNTAETAVQIGAKTVRIWCGKKSSNETSDEEFREMVAETEEIADIAEKYGLTVAFEFHHNTYNDSGEASLKFLKAVNKANVKTYWQPFSLEEDTQNLTAVAEYLAGIHIFCWDKHGRRFPLSYGEKEWRSYLDIIKNKNITVPYIMEFVKDDSTEQFKEDVAFIKKLICGA